MYSEIPGAEVRAGQTRPVGRTSLNVAMVAHTGPVGKVIKNSGIRANSVGSVLFVHHDEQHDHRGARGNAVGQVGVHPYPGTRTGIVMIFADD